MKQRTKRAAEPAAEAAKRPGAKKRFGRPRRPEPSLSGKRPASSTPPPLPVQHRARQKNELVRLAEFEQQDRVAELKGQGFTHLQIARALGIELGVVNRLWDVAFAEARDRRDMRVAEAIYKLDRRYEQIVRAWWAPAVGGRMVDAAGNEQIIARDPEAARIVLRATRDQGLLHASKIEQHLTLQNITTTAASVESPVLDEKAIAAQLRMAVSERMSAEFTTSVGVPKLPEIIDVPPAEAAAAPIANEVDRDATNEKRRKG